MSEAFVARYLPNGRLDPGFGSGGVSITSFGVPNPTDKPLFTNRAPSAEYERPIFEVTGLLVDSQGRPVISGTYTYAIEECGYGQSFPQSVVARLTVAGTLDTSFGESGHEKIPGGTVSQLASGPSGEIAAFSAEVFPCAERGRIGESWFSSVLTEGRVASPVLDPSRPRLGGSTGLQIDSHGRLLYSENEGNIYTEGGPAKIVRLLPNGDIDAGFGHEGAVVLSRFGNAPVDALAIDGKDRPVAVLGSSEIELLRTTEDGKIDHTFARGSALRAKVTGGSSIRPEAVAIDSKGRIVVAGGTEGGSLKTGYGVGIARFLPGR